MMKKESEIKIVEQIEALIIKLYNTDTYFRDDLKHHNFDFDDFAKIVYNIKNDFPMFGSTGLMYRIYRTYNLYKKRCNTLISMFKMQSFSIGAYQTTIKDLEAENKSLRQFKTTMLSNILEVYYSFDEDQTKNELSGIINSYPDDEVIKIKLEYDYPLTTEERNKVITALKYRT